MDHAETVADLGEDALLARIFPLLPSSPATLLGPGDDAAVLAAPDGRVVVSTDVLVEGRHFRRAWSSGYDVGWRAAVQNLADVAAMGARPTGLVVALVAPGDLPVAWALDLARGLAAAGAPHGAGVVGGDLSGGTEVVVAVTVHGDLEGRAPVLRSGARPGDLVAHSGALGRSAAGLALLEAGLGEAAGCADLVQAYLRPVSPLATAVSAARAGASAMLDVSDGLLRDAGRIARASEVVIDLDAPDLVLARELEALSPAASALGADPLAWLLTGGEDHGFLATFPSAELPEGFVPVGQVRRGHPTVLVDGGPPPVVGTGWDHFTPGAGSQPLR